MPGSSHDPFAEELPPGGSPSPWRPVFDEVRRVAGGAKDAAGTVGSINWLKVAMERSGANPNVVRNIIYRNKGRLPDKRALYLILDELWRQAGNGPLEIPELSALSSPHAAAELEVAQQLGREQRRAYRALIGGVRAGQTPKVLVTGRPGSGKTMLTDYLQEGLELPPKVLGAVVRSEFMDVDIGAALARLATELGAEAEVVESRLVRVGAGSAYAVQADAQAELARMVLEAARQPGDTRALLFHLSRSLSSGGLMTGVPLRLNTPDVPRVSATEWLWLSLLEPLSYAPDVAVYASMADLPARAAQRPGAFGPPIRLMPPSKAESRRFVRSRLPSVEAVEQEELVALAGRSYEELRTLTLLKLARRPGNGAPEHDSQSIEQLSRLAGPAGDGQSRSLLCALAVLSSPEFAGFPLSALLALSNSRRNGLNDFERSFLDPVPGLPGHYRSFSRQLTRAVQERLQSEDAALWRRLHAAAADQFRAEAEQAPDSEAAARFLHHCLGAQDWETLIAWLEQRGAPYPLVQRIWRRARQEQAGPEPLERLARQVANHFVRLGAYDHVEAVRAFELLSASSRADHRAWAAVKRAEAEVAGGRFERAETLLDTSPDSEEPLVRAEKSLVRASVRRWRGELNVAASLVAAVIKEWAQPPAGHETPRGRSLRAKAMFWAGLIAKDRGDMEAAERAFDRCEAVGDDLIRARVAFQRGDLLFRQGRFDGAVAALDNAIRLGEGSEALAQELSRYLSRRGRLRRLRGDIAGSKADFAAGRKRLAEAAGEGDPLDSAFWLARLEDEAAYTALAEGAFEEAALRLTGAVETFRDYQLRRGLDANFRVLHASLHLAVAYAFRGLGLPLRRPFPALAQAAAGPDLRHAFSGLSALAAELREPELAEGRGADSAGQRHLRELLMRIELVSTLIEGDCQAALGHAERALELAVNAHQRAECQAGLACARLRLGDGRASLAAVATGQHELAAILAGCGPEERGDLGLAAQLSAYAGCAMLRDGNHDGAAELLCLDLEDSRLEPFHEGLLRSFGGAVEELGVANNWRRHRRLRSLLGLHTTTPSTPARLPDALVAAWRARRDHPVAG